MSIRVPNKLVYGIGINDLYGYTSKNPKIFRTWQSMFARCYSTAPTREICYEGVTVCDDWVFLSNFIKWMENKDYEGKVLDKDIIFPYNKIYSPENCIFVTNAINVLLTGNRKDRGIYPRGVVYDDSGRASKKYRASISKYGKRIRLGRFKTPEEAYEVYCKERYDYIIEVASNLTKEDTSDIERTKEGLIRHAELLLQ